MTPDASGKFKGISVPSIPWSEKGHGMNGSVYCYCARVFPDCEPATSEMEDQNSVWVPLCERCQQIAFEAGVRVRKLQPRRPAGLATNQPRTER